MSSEDSDSKLRLTETSYIVLGLLEQIEPATPYDVKQVAQISTANFWALPHTQLYTECARLAGEGLLDERREETGRRRRIYRLTKRGREYLDAWRGVVESDHYELRDEATLKLFFGADPEALAATQVEAHEARLRIYEQLLERAEGLPRGQRLALDCGIGHEREFVRFWSSLARGD
ncbi:MAG TPA: PadR family transcriptional regulator [Solirubrobacteraceae bacterium]|jgi:DNA-binding PadR family transcriptional regulator|nr:PadR family transcriptional regulator [Solirubrobacteraceae bacterium]